MFRLTVVQLLQIILRVQDRRFFAGQRVGHLTLALVLALLSSGIRAEADISSGEVLFKRLCANCHKVGPGARAAFGPQLNGIFGRQAGSTSDYQYSSAMRQSSVRWDREKLTAFIRDTDDVVPGNKMRFWGISDQEKIDSLLLFLQSQQEH